MDFARFYDTETFSDLVAIVGTERIFVHGIVISAASDFLAKHIGEVDSESHRRELDLRDFSPGATKPILRRIYGLPDEMPGLYDAVEASKFAFLCGMDSLGEEIFAWAAERATDPILVVDLLTLTKYAPSCYPLAHRLLGESELDRKAIVSATENRWNAAALAKLFPWNDSSVHAPKVPFLKLSQAWERKSDRRYSRTTRGYVWNSHGFHSCTEEIESLELRNLEAISNSPFGTFHHSNWGEKGPTFVFTLGGRSKRSKLLTESGDISGYGTVGWPASFDTMVYVLVDEHLFAFTEYGVLRIVIDLPGRTARVFPPQKFQRRYGLYPGDWTVDFDRKKIYVLRLDWETQTYRLFSSSFDLEKCEQEIYEEIDCNRTKSESDWKLMPLAAEESLIVAEVVSGRNASGPRHILNVRDLTTGRILHSYRANLLEGSWDVDPDARLLAYADGNVLREVDLTSGRTIRTENYDEPQTRIRLQYHPLPSSIREDVPGLIDCLAF